MLKALQYILYPPRFVRDMRAFRVSEFSVFVVFFVGLLLWAYAYAALVVLRLDVVLSLVFALFSYGLYVYYKVHWVPYLTLYLCICTIVNVWMHIASLLFDALSIYFAWGVDEVVFLLFYNLLWALFYLVLFHMICRDMEDKRSDGMVVVRRG